MQDRPAGEGRGLYKAKEMPEMRRNLFCKVSGTCYNKRVTSLVALVGMSRRKIPCAETEGQAENWPAGEERSQKIWRRPWAK